MAVALSSSGCSDLPDVPLNRCGNHVVEDNEDCDRTGPSCGAPGTGAACRFLCDRTSGLSCESGFTCGRDNICRMPLGTYRLGPEVTQSGESVQVADFDGDAYPDLVIRTLGRLALSRNDHSGHFSPYASGAARPQIVDPSIEPGLATVALSPPGAPMPILASITNFAIDSFNANRVDLYTWRDGDLSPLVVPNLRLPRPSSSRPRQLIGGALLAGEPMPVFLEPEQARVSAYLPPLDFSVTEPFDSVPLDGNCALDVSQPVETALRNDPPERSGFVLLGADAAGAPVVCFGDLRPQQLGLQQLPTASLLLDGGGVALILDLDGNGLLDVVLLTKQKKKDVNVYWLQTAAGFLPPVLVAGSSGVTPAGFVGTGVSVYADFDGDGREDVAGTMVLINDTTGSEASFSWDDGLPIRFDLADTGLLLDMVPGDLNGDHQADIVAWTPWGALIPCFGDGTVRFTCAPANSGLTIEALCIADVTGDRKDDVLLLEGSGATNAIGLLPGADPAALLLSTSLARPLVGTRISRMTLAPPQTLHIGQQIYSLIEGDGGAQGLAIGDATAGGELQFGYSIVADDVALADFTGDGNTDLAVIERGNFKLLDGALPFAVNDLATPLPDQGKFCAIDPKGPPALCGLSKGASVVAVWTGGGFDLQSFASNAKSATFLTADLDGDGRNEVLYVLHPGDGTCSLRVLHQPASGRFEATDSPLAACGRPMLADLPPIDGLLDVVVEDSSGKRYFHRQVDDFSFQGRAPEDPGLSILDEQGSEIDPARLTWLATTDFDGDSLTDVLFSDEHGRAHIAFAEVKRR